MKKNITILLEKYSIEKIGISLAGHVKDNVLIHSPNLPELNETNFAKILNDIFSIPVLQRQNENMAVSKIMKEVFSLLLELE